MATVTTATTQSVRVAMALKQNNCNSNTTGSLSNNMHGSNNTNNSNSSYINNSKNTNNNKNCNCHS